MSVLEKLGLLRWMPHSESSARLVSEHQFNRIVSMERNIGLPLRAGLMLAAIYHIRLSRELTGPLWSMSELFGDIFRGAMAAYVLVNVAASVLLFVTARAGWGWMRWGVFTVCLMDGFFLALATLASGGYASGLYWAFLGILVRNAFSLPVPALQLILNAATCAMYAAVGWTEAVLRKGELVLDETLQADVPWVLGEDFGLRLLILGLVSACGYGLQVLYDRRIVSEAEKQDLTLRTEQLHAAGRLAAEIAHQLKNPLAIINNAAFNLQRRSQEKSESERGQLAIIRDEVGRCDRIISELMGYSQLAEATVERLDLRDILETALGRAFPPGLADMAGVERDYTANTPSVLVHRQQIEEALVNLLINAREAAGPQGHVGVSLRPLGGHGAAITVSDDGPGIAPENLKRVFEAYFTTKERGTGLGLAIARNAAELNGGTLKVESGTGRGARFVLELPSKHPAPAKK
jgi:signal transduction histidine kinase